ncbi:MAG: GNAT family N-acetyltransferase [Deltaproteobacteria bacterium]|nr:GNAT family N-acetyltransferase [Deltaproteobacteria bacterium]
MISVEVIDPLGDSRWLAVEALPGAALYHSQAWARVIAATYGFAPRYYVASAQGKVIGGLPGFELGGLWRGRRWVSLPFSDAGGPVGGANAVSALLAAALRDAGERNWRALEVRGALADSARTQLAETLHNDSYLLSLERPLHLLERAFSDSVRWGRKRALRAGVSVAQAADLPALREFYRLHQITRRRLGVPVQSWRFFELLGREFLARDAGFVVTARHGGRAIASAVFLRFGACLYYKFSAADPRRLEVQPNSLVLWRAIAWAKSADLAALDLGKTVRENAGLARFKRSWGAVAQPLPYYYFPRVTGVGAQSEDSARLRAIRAVWRHLPLAVTRWLGGWMYRVLA